MRGRTRMRWVAVAAAVAMVATACGDDDDAGADPTTGEALSGGSFSIYINEPQFMVPGNANETGGAQVLRTIFAGLFDYSPDVELVAVMAEGMPETTDNITWTIRVKEGWTFHNGEPVTAQSYVDGWNTTAYGPNAWNNNYFLAPIAGYEDLNPSEGEPTATEMSGLRAVDDTTIEVTLSEPFSGFPYVLGYTAFYPMSQACKADLEACNEAPIGNGPYMIDGIWEHNVQINTVKYAAYQGTPGVADEITFQIYETQDAAYADFVGGELDIMPTVPAERVVEARTTYGDRLIEETTSNFTYFGLPVYVEQLADPRVRQALSLAIDRQAIIDNVFDGRFQPADNVASPVVAGYEAGACEFCAYDPERAAELLAEAGGWPGGTLELWFNAGVGHEVWVQALGDQIRQNLGIEYELRGDLEFADYLTLADGGVDDDPATEGFTGGYRLGWVMDYPLIENYITPLHGCGASSNYSGYCNEAVDALVAEGNAAPTPDEGLASYMEAANLVMQDMPIIPMWFGRSSMAYNETVTNVIVTPFTLIDLASVQVVDGG